MCYRVQLRMRQLEKIGFIFLVAVSGGCSSTSERWSSTTFQSGYEDSASIQPSAPNLSASPVVITPQGRRAAELSPYSNPGVKTPGSGYQLASFKPEEPLGHLQMARMDLPPLVAQPQEKSSNGRVRTADGYGVYNKGPLADGSYSGPRVYTPYAGPKDQEPLQFREREPYRDRYEPTPPPVVYKPKYEDRAYDGPAREPVPSRYDAPRDYEPQREIEPLRYPPSRKLPDRIYKESYAPPRREQPPVIIEQPISEKPPVLIEKPVGFYPDSRSNKRPPTELEIKSPVDASNIKRPGDPVAADRGNGKVITVAPGETLYTLAIRHGVTVDMIAKANALDERRIKPGQELLIPATSAGPVTFSNVEAQRDGANTDPCQSQKCHTVKAGETLNAIAIQYGVAAHRILEANRIAQARELKAGQVLVIPGMSKSVQSDDKTGNFYRVSQVESQGQASADVKPLQPTLDAKQGQEQPAVGQEAKSSTSQQSSQGGEASCEAGLNNPLPRTGKTFRKPVEGLVIATFGPQRNGTHNEGVTISVPRGTPIKAAENGIVAYVGDELPGFGNLILVRHADDFVTAYAHADSVDVKKCDVVKRGQIIGKAGASGGVSQPQLHFEIRKSSKPVDPAPLLAS